MPGPAVTASRDEIRGLTALRGVAAMLVVIYHLDDKFGSGLDLAHTTPFFARGYLWVDFFFVLSGFIVAYVYCRSFVALDRPGYARFLQKRLARIWPLHVFILFCTIPTEALKLVVASDAIPPFAQNGGGAFLANLFLVQAWHLLPCLTWNLPAWSISAEWAAYLMAPAIFALFFRARWLWTLLATLATALGLYALCYGLHGGTLDFAIDFGVLRCAASFAFGMLGYRIYESLGRHGAARRIVAHDAVFALCLLAIVVVMSTGGPDLSLVPLFWLLVLTTALNRGLAARLLGCRPLYFLGVISYSIYLTHYLVVRGWILLHEKFFPDLTMASALLALALLLLLVVGVSALTYRFVEVPGRRAMSPAAGRRSGTAILAAQA